jgi:hypothetical protein
MFRYLSDDSLLFDLPDGAAALSLPLESVHRVDTVQGQKSRWLSGIGFGLLIGAVGGTVIGYAATAGDVWYPGMGAAAGFILGAPIGMITGGIVGAFLKTESWKSVPLDRLRVSFAPQRDRRFALGVQLRL